jgi:hypothetical protein
LCSGLAKSIFVILTKNMEKINIEENL